MAYRIQRQYSMNPTTIDLLEQIARHYSSDGKRPNVSRTLRALIVEKAAVLGLTPKMMKPKSNKKRARSVKTTQARPTS